MRGATRARLGCLGGVSPGATRARLGRLGGASRGTARRWSRVPSPSRVQRVAPRGGVLCCGRGSKAGALDAGSGSRSVVEGYDVCGSTEPGWWQTKESNSEARARVSGSVVLVVKVRAAAAGAEAEFSRQLIGSSYVEEVDCCVWQALIGSSGKKWDLSLHAERKAACLAASPRCLNVYWSNWSPGGGWG